MFVLYTSLFEQNPLNHSIAVFGATSSIYKTLVARWLDVLQKVEEARFCKQNEIPKQ